MLKDRNIYKGDKGVKSLKSYLGISKNHCEVLVMTRVKRSLELMYTDEVIQNEIEDMICAGDELRRQQSAMKHEEEDEQAELDKLKRCESNLSRAELHK